MGWCNTVVTIDLLERFRPLCCATERVLAAVGWPCFGSAWECCSLRFSYETTLTAFCTRGELIVFC
jgi:hypothetical protein